MWALLDTYLGGLGKQILDWITLLYMDALVYNFHVRKYQWNRISSKIIMSGKEDYLMCIIIWESSNLPSLIE